MAKAKKKMGAKGKYAKWLKAENLVLLEGWARDGLTDKQLAKNMGIARSTLSKWKNEYIDISDALKNGKEISDYEVQNAMHKKATGYYIKEEQAFKCKRVYYDTNGKRCEEEELKIVEVEKYMPPDSTMQIFWSKNRMPSKWRDRPIAESINLSINDSLLAAIEDAGLDIFSEEDLTQQEEDPTDEV